MSPTPFAAAALAAIGGLALVLPLGVVVLLLAGLVAAVVVDARMTAKPPDVERVGATMLARGVPAALGLTLAAAPPGAIRLRQPVPPDLRVEPSEGRAGLDATVVAARRGRHVLPEPAVRIRGPLGLVARHRRAGGERELRVYPDLPAARRLAAAVRQGRFGDAGRLRRGPLGLGTDFEAVRDYSPDDDIRQVNWRATGRLGRPMSNQFRMEQDREVVCVIDTGRLMGAPLGERTRVDAAIDAAVAVAMVADELGDHCGAVAFDNEIIRRVTARRRGAEAIVEALFDVEPSARESDYELAFRTVAGGKRALVIVFTDLLEEAAARPLLQAMPYLTRRHAVVVATAADSDLTQILERDPTTSDQVHESAVAADVLAARARVAAQLRAAGADVLEAPPDRLAAACIVSYLRAKQRAKL